MQSALSVNKGSYFLRSEYAQLCLTSTLNVWTISAHFDHILLDICGILDICEYPELILLITFLIKTGSLVKLLETFITALYHLVSSMLIAIPKMCSIYLLLILLAVYWRNCSKASA